MFNKKPSDHLQRTWAAIAVGAVSIGVGVAERASARKKSNKLLAQREEYKTPKEVVEVLNATKMNAQQGFDATTLDFLTNQTDQAFAGSLGSAERLGADPNVLSSIFSQKIDSIKGIAAQNHALQMQNFSTYLNALNATGASSAAEQKSQQDLLKDELQVVALEKQAATGQISQGINSVISGAASYGMGNLYGVGGGGVNEVDKFTNAFGPQGQSAYQYAQANNLSFNQYMNRFNKLKKTF